MTTAMDNGIVLEEESQYGTAVTPTRALDFISESLQIRKHIKESPALRVGAGSVKQGARRVVTMTDAAGPVEFELQSKGLGKVLKACMGAATHQSVGTPAGLFQSVFTLGDVLTSLTFQKQLPSLNAAGTGFDLNPFTFAGSVVEGFELTFPQDEKARLKVDLDCKSVTKATALVTPLTYGSNIGLYHFGGFCVKTGTLTAATATVLASAPMSIARLKSFTLQVKNNLSGSGPYACTGKGQPIPSGRDITGTAVVEYVSGGPFVDAVMLDTGMTLVASCGSHTDANELFQVVLGDVRFGDSLPTANAGQIIELSLPFEAYKPATGEALVLVQRTFDTAL